MPAPKWLQEAAKIQLLPGRTSEPLRLLRALLRECTYLPDPAARVYMKEHILTRYRAYQPRQARKGEYIRPLLHERFTQLNKTARKGLSQLQKANAGHTEQLIRVLYLTYGRTGKRRYELLASLKRGDIPESTKRLDLISKQLKKQNVPSETISKTPKFSQQLEALLHSHRIAQPPHVTRSKLKTLNLGIAEKNSWERPMPQKRVLNMVKEWHGLTLHKVLPPLPEDEWERLGKLATGEERWKGLVKRRPAGPGEMESSSDFEVEEFSKELQHELKITRIPKHTRVDVVPHNLTPRLMQRLWLNVFKMCPTMDWDTENQIWKTRWGNQHAERYFSMRVPRNARLLEVLENATGGEEAD